MEKILNYQTVDITADTDNWAIRSAYWNSKSQLEIPKRKRREKAKEALILTGNGLSIRVDKGRLLIKDGFTYYPQKQIIKAYFKGALDIPPRIVLVDGKGSITLDALDWLAEQGVPLIRVKYNGQFLSLITSGGQAADPEKLIWQVKAQSDEAERMAFAIPLIIKKFENSLVTLDGYIPESRYRHTAEAKIIEFIHKLKATPPKTLRELTAIEAQVASAYFRSWQELDIKCKAKTRSPIPAEWRVFTSRSSLKRDQKAENVRASHPVNAMLNYVYTVLTNQMQIKAIADGFDPTYGIFHNRWRGKRARLNPSFALDIMEPLRPVVDRVVLKLLNEETFSGADFDMQSDGVCRLNPELARRLLLGCNVN